MVGEGRYLESVLRETLSDILMMIGAARSNRADAPHSSGEFSVCVYYFFFRKHCEQTKAGELSGP